LLRDLADAAETYPGAHWPVQITQALQGLIHAASRARRQGLAAVPDEVAGPLAHAFRHGVILGLSQVQRVGECSAFSASRSSRCPRATHRSHG